MANPALDESRRRDSVLEEILSLRKFCVWTVEADGVNAVSINPPGPTEASSRPAVMEPGLEPGVEAGPARSVVEELLQRHCAWET